MTTANSSTDHFGTFSPAPTPRYCCGFECPSILPKRSHSPPVPLLPQRRPLKNNRIPLRQTYSIKFICSHCNRNNTKTKDVQNNRCANEIFEMKTSVHLTLKLPGALKLPGDPFESPIAFGHPSNLTDGFSSIAEQHKILFQDTKKYDVNM